MNNEIDQKRLENELLTLATEMGLVWPTAGSEKKLTAFESFIKGELIPAKEYTLLT